LPEVRGPVRNLIGCVMAFRREAFIEAGNFTTELGRTASRPMGCEETELCIRVGRLRGHGSIVYEPLAVVDHTVPADRSTLRYFVSRCYAEGVSKAQVSSMVGSEDALATERSYVSRTLPVGFLRGLGDLLRGRPAGVARSLAIVAGLFVTTAGYVRGLAAVHRPAGADPFDGGSPDPLAPVRLIDVELTEPVADLTVGKAPNGERYRRVRCLVRNAGVPVGEFQFDTDQPRVSGAELAARASGLTLHDKTPRRTDQSGDDVTVVVATRRRPESLQRTLASLARSTPLPSRVVVVENTPAPEAARRVVQECDLALDIRYVHAAQPGLAAAHNAGLAVVETPLVAFTDDDVEVDPLWVGAIAETFGDDTRVGCVTGPIRPAALDHPAQLVVEGIGMSKGYDVRRFDLAEHRPDSALFPYASGVCGSGANMAFRTGPLRARGGFDPALGAGSPGAGGDDLAAFYDTITAGLTIVYQPGALVAHHHDPDEDRLQVQAYSYGKGLGAHLTRCMASGSAPAMLVRLPAAVAEFRRQQSSPSQSAFAGLRRRRLRGLIAGPYGYLRGRRLARTFAADTFGKRPR
jgi:GT2 family glycosyltransferase